MRIERRKKLFQKEKKMKDERGQIKKDEKGRNLKINKNEYLV